MSLSSLLLSVLGPAVAKKILGSWLNDSLAGKVGEEIVDNLKESILDLPNQQDVQQKVEQLSEQILARMSPIFEHEARNISIGSRTAIQLALAETLLKVGTKTESLIEIDLDPTTLYQHFRQNNPKAAQHFTRDETALYERMLFEASQSLVDFAPQLEDFSYNFAAATLQRLSEIIRILQAEKARALQEEDEFLNKYRGAVERELDHMEVFGLPTMDRLTSRQSLSMAYITLLATEHRDMKQLHLFDELENDVVQKQNLKLDDEVVPQLISQTIDEDFSEEVASLETEPVPFTLPTLVQRSGRVSRLRSGRIDEIICLCNRLIIRGGAGAGKSTLLQWLAVRAAKQDFPKKLQHWNFLVPFFIRLRSLVGKRFPTPEEFPAPIARNHTSTMPSGWVHRYLDRGQALVLIDGVDELPRQERQEFFEELKRLVADFPKNIYVVTSRPSGLKSNQGDSWEEWEEWVEQENFKNLSLKSMDSTDISNFVTRWHKALISANRVEDENIDLNSTAENLKRLLNQRSELRRLATTPLLCAMICALHRERGETLPTARIQLYRECIDMLLNRRDLGRRIQLDESYPSGLTEDQKIAFIQSLAYWLMQNNLSDIETDRVDMHFERRLELMNLPEEVTGPQIRALFVDRSGLLREPVVGRIDFAHRTFQEYLAARAALAEDSLGVVLQYAYNDQWREAIIVAAGLARKNELKQLLEELIERGNREVDKKHYLHLLATACLETAVEVAPELRRKVLEHAQALLPPKDTDEVEMVAKAGDAIAPLLAYNSSYPVSEIRNCISALSKIGSRTAAKSIASYTAAQIHPRQILSRELGEAWDSFDRRLFAREALAHARYLTLSNLSSWEGFEYLTDLSELLVRRSNLSDLGALESCANLSVLGFDFCKLQSFHQLTALPKLSKLQLYNTNVNDYLSLKELNQLTGLTIYLREFPNNYFDIRILETFVKLEYLNLGDLNLTDLQFLTKLDNLVSLNLLGESVSDLTYLSALTRLKSLGIGTTRGFFFPYPRPYESKPTLVSDIDPLGELKELEDLFINSTQIQDLSPLSLLTKLERLSIGGSPIEDLTPLASLQNLRRLHLRELAIQDLHFVLSLINLRELNIIDCYVQDIKPLAALPSLRVLNLMGSKIQDQDFDAFRELENLKIRVSKDLAIHLRNKGFSNISSY